MTAFCIPGLWELTLYQDSQDEGLLCLLSTHYTSGISNSHVLCSPQKCEVNERYTVHS